MSFPVKHDLAVGQWWVPTEKGPHLKPRWILGIMGDPVRVRYSNGGDGHRMCLRHSFAFWITRTKAERNLELPIDGGDQRAQDSLLRAGA